MRTATARLPGHPDHACELIAEAIVDEYARRDAEARIRLSVSGGRGLLFIAGDVLSQADFDVSAIAKRAAGSLGITEELEPFVSIEPVAAPQVAERRLACDTPVTVTGYATSETQELIPLPAALARRVAKRLQEKRSNDPEWFWLGPDAEVTVQAEDSRPSHVIVSVEHGNEPLEIVRERVATELASLFENEKLEVNPTGPREQRGLAGQTGSSGRGVSPYGSLVPFNISTSGHDAMSVEKAGAWIARAAALKIVRDGARAALVQLVYNPGDENPIFILAKDECGRDCSSKLQKEDLNLARVRDWLRPGLNYEAALWGFAGEAGLPWEA